MIEYQQNWIAADKNPYFVTFLASVYFESRAEDNLLFSFKADGFWIETILVAVKFFELLGAATPCLAILCDFGVNGSTVTWFSFVLGASIILVVLCALTVQAADAVNEFKHCD